MRTAEAWFPAIVAAVDDLTPQIREIRLMPEYGVAPFAPGSHIEIRVLVDGQPQTRSYSLVGADATGYRVAVQLSKDGKGGSRYMWSLRPGSRVEVSAPINSFDLDWGRDRYCLIAGGIGITPLVAMADTLARRGAAYKLHYCCASADSAAYLEHLRDVHGDRLTVHASDAGDRIDLAATFAALPPGAIVALCGPMRLLDTARRAWAAAGRDPVDLRYETFGSSGLLATEPFQVRIRDADVEIEVPPNRSMLAVLREAGHDIISHCEIGECGICAIDVVEVDGVIDHRDVFFSNRQREENRKICPCVSRAHGTLTVDTLHRLD